jgi:hypothetical protein
MDQFNQAILDDAVAFCEQFGLSDAKFGQLSPINDTHLMERLKAGRCRRDSVVRIRKFMQRYELDVA